MEKIIHVDFNTFRDFFNKSTLDSDFMLFDNVMEVIENNEDLNSFDFKFLPIKLETTMIVLCTEGEFKARIGLKEIHVEKNRLMVILPNQIFQITALNRKFKGMFFILKTSFFNIQNYVMEAMNLQRIILQEHCLEIPETLISEFKTIYHLIKDKIKEEHNPYRKQIIQSYCSILFYDACNLYLLKNTENNTKKTHKEEIFEAFIKEAEKHYRKEHEVTFYADKLCLTPKYLSSIVFEVSGKSASNWLKDYLILEAQALLFSSHMNIQQISNELNFANQSHFGNFFKRYTGLSPREFLKKSS